MQLTHQLAQTIEESIVDLQKANDLPAFEMPTVLVERPRLIDHGDYATSVPLQLAKLAQQKPLDIAQKIIGSMSVPDFVAKAEIAPPGFINFWVETTHLQNLILEILDGNRFGTVSLGNGQKAQVEFVSANPTGPITVGRTRGAVIGDTLARALEAADYEVTKEYYYNDTGRQIILLGESVKIRYLNLLGQDAVLGADHYQGDYVANLAQEIFDLYGAKWGAATLEQFGDFAKEKISIAQKETLTRLGVQHDVFFNEEDLYSTGRLWDTLAELEENGFVYAGEDGAKWLKTSEFGDEKDRIIIRSIDGRPTYRLPDIAYHADKIKREFDLIIDVFGPDHQAVAEQVKIGLRMLGLDADKVHTLIHHVVTLVKDGESVKMSTRAGQYVTLDELIDQVGADAVRYFMLARSANQPVAFDLDLAIEQKNENPVFYMQNAHVRCAGILRNVASAGIEPLGLTDVDLTILDHPNELNFLRKVLELPDVIERVVIGREPHRFATYGMELASALHSVYETCSVLNISDDRNLQSARFYFYGAAKKVLAETLDLMGMTAPETM